MTDPTPGRPLDVEALRKRRQDAEQHVRDLGLGVLIGPDMRGVSLSFREADAILAELEGLRTEVERLRTEPCSGACLLKLKHHGEPDCGEPPARRRR